MKKKGIAILLAVLMLTALLSASVSAADAEGTLSTNANIKWKYTEATTTLEISLADTAGSGIMDDFTEETKAPWAELAADITDITVGEGVTGIGNNAFAGITMESLTLPATVTAIGENALPTGLTTIVIPCTGSAEDIQGVPTTVTVTNPHHLTHHDAVSAELTKDGTKEYWECSVCKKLFSDAEGKTVIAAPEVAPKLDQTAPVTEIVYLTPSSVILPATTAGSSLVTVVVVTDDGAGSGCVTGSVILTNTAKSGAPALTCTLSPDSIDGSTMSGTVLFSDNMLSGQYYISEVTLTDAASNSATYTNAQLPALYQGQNVYVYRNSKIQTIGTLTLNATSVGYGGVVTGTVTLKDYSGNAIAKKSVDIYVGGVKTGITVVTDATGTATFDYSNSVPGTYSLEAKFTEDEDYAASSIAAVTLTVTNVPATGDHYEIGLWVCVAVLAVGANVWFFRRRKTV